MALKSNLFKGNARLERCLVSDTAHIQLNDRGDYVSKIQIALQLVNNSSITTNELRMTVFGQSTSTAVLAFKTDRHIINRARETRPDPIVGKMTIAALDDELSKLPPAPAPTPDLGRLQFRHVPLLNIGGTHSNLRNVGGFDPLNFGLGKGGFDPKPSNASRTGESFQMVPAEGGTRELWIIDKLMAAGKMGLRFDLVGVGGHGEVNHIVSMEEVKPALAAQAHVRAIRLTGHTFGGAQLRAFDVGSGKILASVQIAVLPKKNYKVGYLFYTSKNPNHVFPQNASQVVNLWHSTLNMTWQAQANIAFSNAGTDKYFGVREDEVFSAELLLAMSSIVRNGVEKIMPGCDRYVVLVPHIKAPVLGVTKEVIFLPYNDGAPSYTIAHEFGHSFGLKHETALGVEKNLMYKFQVDLNVQFDLNKDQIVGTNLHPGIWRDVLAD